MFQHKLWGDMQDTEYLQTHLELIFTTPDRMGRNNGKALVGYYLLPFTVIIKGQTFPLVCFPTIFNLMKISRLEGFNFLYVLRIHFLHFYTKYFMEEHSL